jgi:hypothetical protein
MEMNPRPREDEAAEEAALLREHGERVRDAVRVVASEQREILDRLKDA